MATPAERQVGKPGFASEVGDLAYFALDAIRAMPTVPRFTAEVLRQTAIFIKGSLLVIAAFVMFIGFTQVNYAYFFLKSAGASDYTGLFTGLTTPRAAVLIMFGYVFAAKVGGGLAAEVGSMRISEEIDALEAEAINPMSYLIGTRILGAALFAPMAAVVALLACTLGSYLQAVPALQGLSSDTFLHYHWAVQNLTDQLLCIFNLMLQGMVIVLVSCYYGYKASGGPTAVGAAVARSLLVNIVAIHVLVAAHIMIFYGLTPTLPIGG